MTSRRRRGGGPGRSSRSFSKDAVGLETELHRQFASKRVNQVNSRKEFFYATPAEVRDALQQFAGQHLIEFTEEPRHWSGGPEGAWAKSVRPPQAQAELPPGRHEVRSGLITIGGMDWLERAAKLRQWSRGGVRAPHKPLLLLYALGRFQADAADELPYSAVENHRSWHTSQVFRGTPRPRAPRPAAGQRGGVG